MDQRLRSKYVLYYLLFIGGLLISLIIYSYNLKSYGSDIPSCRPVWMGPSYARIKSFDESYTKLASKYSLYLYREQGKNKIPEEQSTDQLLSGIPVLFIPGNAGSFRQARSIASESSNLYFEQLEKYTEINPNIQELDFFTADFNEDFTAFHGRTILDQAEFLNEAIKYILELYKDHNDPPRSVIIIGHSMGGIVARLMITLPNYLQDSINTIITLSSPHSAAPLTFDGDILRIYNAIDQFWYFGYNDPLKNEYSKLANSRIKNVSLISITGGETDTTLPADYTTLGFLVPSSNGFTIFATGIPQVWTPIDHLAIVWCAQLRTKIAESLLEIINKQDVHKTYSLEKRMEIFRNKFMTGFESLAIGETEFESNENSIQLEKDKHLSLISLDKIEVKLCKSEKCITMKSQLVPKSTGDLIISDSSLGGNEQPMHVLNIPSSITNEYDYLIKGDAAEYQFNTETNYIIDGNLIFGKSITIPEDHPLSFNINIPHAWNSLLVYNAKFNYEQGDKFYYTFVRQWVEEPFETKWHINLQPNKNYKLTQHSVSPYVPFKSDSNHGMNLQIWLNSKSETTISISIDLISSLKLLILRYRLSLVSMILSITSLVTIFQYLKFDKFPNLINRLGYINSKYGLIIGIILIILNPIVKSYPHVFNLIDLVVFQDYNEINLSLSSNFKLNSFYLGLQENFSIIGLILYFISNFILILTYHLIISCCYLLNFIIKRVRSSTNNRNSKYKLYLTIFLIVLIPIYIPYQVVYVICCLIQIINVLKSYNNNQLFNYQVSWLILMLWILPINIPILIVFIHNLSINWKTPFSSHHNLLSILPILLLVQKNNQLEKLKQSKYNILIILGLGYLIFYSLIYGNRHTFWLYHLFNFVSLINLIILNIEK
ncbi:unnamed protein product [Candida verbasci]|uniref:GPI inositol-deacylase n=1 Tax=Candida verbasci TaxID=1227364 RepID=A0A9W4TWI2_9ASCO|nr:unnamed protein product [Candida verbasci]